VLPAVEERVLGHQRNVDTGGDDDERGATEKRQEVSPSAKDSSATCSTRRSPSSTSLLPQFVGARSAAAGDLLLLGALFNAMGLFWLLTYAVLAARGRDMLGRPKVKRILDRATGFVLVGLGTRLALEHRR
jgi:hypothetical protein